MVLYIDHLCYLEQLQDPTKPQLDLARGVIRMDHVTRDQPEPFGSSPLCRGLVENPHQPTRPSLPLTLAAWRDRRQHNLAWPAGLDLEEQRRTGVLPQLGPISADEQVCEWAYHDVEHRRQLMAVLEHRLHRPRRIELGIVTLQSTANSTMSGGRRVKQTPPAVLRSPTPPGPSRRTSAVRPVPRGHPQP